MTDQNAKKEVPPTPSEAFIEAMQELGGKYIALGEAMQKPDTTAAELVTLSNACGLNLQLGFSSKTNG